MCGLVGFYNPYLDQNERNRMATHLADSLRHRGPDDSSTWSNEGGLTFAHRRLAILDLSPHAKQPMVSPRTGTVLVYNGEIYNYRSIRKELEWSGLSFHGSGDTEVLLAAIDHWGLEKTLTKCNGMFAICLWNENERTLHIARDRIGIKPLYYGWLKSGFVVTSELKALYGLKEFCLPLSSTGLSLFFEHGYISAPYTIFQGIWKMIPGTSLSLSQSELESAPKGFSPYTDRSHLSPKSFWQVPDISPPYSGSLQDAIVDLHELIRDSVRIRSLADVPVGAFLSGGIDSSTIVSCMNNFDPRNVRTFSIGFQESQFNEAPYASAIASHLGTKHTEHYVSTSDALNVIPNLSTIYDEPFADSSQIPTLLLSQLTREQVTVSLSGDGGDELFLGYPRYLLAKRVWSILKNAPYPLRTRLKDGIQAVPSSGWSSVYSIFQWLLPEALRGIRTPGMKVHRFAELLCASNLREVYLQANLHWPPYETPVHRYVPSQTLFHTDIASKTLASRHDYLSFIDFHTYLPDDILTKVDRASMAYGLEARVPLLDHRIIEFARTLPMNWCIAHGSQKYILKKILNRYLPETLFERPKAGFSIPLAKWLRTELRSWAESLLTPTELPPDGLLNRSLILKTWKRHQLEELDLHSKLWNVLIFQQWKRTWSANILDH